MLRIEPRCASRTIRVSIVPSLRSADAFGPATQGLRAALAWGIANAAAIED
ncbi:MAG: hypothetical protein ACKVLM_00375 [Pseudomonadales bacterium]